MGAFSFILYSLKNPNINIDYTNAFLEMKNRGNIEETVYLTKQSTDINNPQIKEKLKYVMSRDLINKYKQYTYIMAVNRLLINDFSANALQPFEDPIIHKLFEYPDLKNRPKRSLLCNGEIYNYNELKNLEKFTDKDLQSNSDVEIILPLYIKYGLEKTLDMINGDFSCIITENLETYDITTTNIYIIRDIIGSKPLYRIKHNKDIHFMFVSELKGVPKYILNDHNYQIDEIPPGTYWSFNNTIIKKSSQEFIRYNDWNIYKSLDSCIVNSTDPDSIYNIYNTINKLLTDSVCDRYKSDAKIGILLSGGFDSSIITSIVARYYASYEITVFTYNNNSYANDVINFLENKYNIDIIHHIIDINSEDFKKFCIDSIENIIYTLETYDKNTITTAIPYAFIYDYISKYTDIKVLLTGYGLNELCGYEEYKNLNHELFQKKTVKMVKNLSKFGLLKNDKMAGRYGLEVRYPFLDKNIIKYILTIHPKIKSSKVYVNNELPIEKYIIRKAFDTDYLPYHILWKRNNNQSNVDIENILINYTNKFDYVLDDIFDTNEKIYYKKTFDKIFGILNGNGSINDKNNSILNSFWEKLWE